MHRDAPHGSLVVADVKDADLSGVFSTLQKIQTDKAADRERSRARIAAWSPTFLRLLDGLRDAGMAPRLVKLEIAA